jgi:cytochrome c553
MPKSRILICAVLLVAAMGGFSGHAKAASQLTEFTSVKVDLPIGDQMFPDGQNSDAINNNCLACHSAGMVLTQPRLPRKAWEAEVDKMRNVYRAPVEDEDAKAIVDYLTRIRGTD